MDTNSTDTSAKKRTQIVMGKVGGCDGRTEVHVHKYIGMFGFLGNRDGLLLLIRKG